MGEEEYVDTILNMDVLLMQVQFDMQNNNSNKALAHIKEVRSMIAEIQQDGDDFGQLNLIK